MGDVVDFFEDVGDWVVGAAEDVGDWVEGAVEDTIDWVENAAEDTAEFFENDVKDFFENDVKDFIDGVGRSLEFFFTGSMDGDDGDNTLVALGFGGTINAYGGNDEIVTGGFYVDIYTGSGDDNVYGAGGGIDITDTDGNLGVYGASGSLSVDKTGNGNIVVGQASIASVIDHTGANGDLTFGGGSAYNELTRKGQSGNVSFKGLGGYNALWHETNHGSLSFEGAGAGNKLDRTWFDQYQGSGGDVTFDGGGASNIISSRVASGNIVFKGAGFYNDIERVGQSGDISVSGAGGYNSIKRTRNHQDEYAATRGNIHFKGFGGYNNIHSDVAHGNINFAGAGGYNDITRQGADSETSGVALATARAEEIVLTRATMGGSWILESQQVTGIKSNREPNTYLFAFADSTYTKINKVQLRNDPQTGKLTYYSTAWYKEGNHLTDLANQDISSASGFNAVNINGAYRLSNLTVEHRQTFTTEGVVDDLTEYEWHPYAGGAHINADDVTLSDAKMSGWAIRYNKELFDVSAVKSNRGKNTYVYGMLDGWHTKVVVVKLANDPETGALKYYSESWYKTGDFTADLANEDISAANGYHSMSVGGYSLSDHHYSVTGVRSSSQRLAHTEEYSDQTLFTPSTSSGESSGDVNFEGGGAANVIRSSVTRGDVNFDGGGIANVILHSSKYGNTDFEGGGGANVVVKSGLEGDLTFRGAGLANVLVHQSQKGKMDVYAGGAVNVLVRIGDGQYLANLLAYGNISVHKGNGDSRVVMLGGYNTHTQVGNGNAMWLAAGGFNVMTHVGKGDVASALVGGANVLTKFGNGDLISGMLGGANIITHISDDMESSDTTAIALGGANILTKKGKGNSLAVMGGGANVMTHVGDGSTTGVMLGGANILTKVGHGNTTGVMLGVGNVLTHVGDGQTIGVMGAVGNIFTKVGDGTSIAAMVGGGNIFTHVGEGDAWALMGGVGNVFTKVGDGNALALMVAAANVYTHIGDGLSVALMVAKGNIATKIGNGTTMAAMVGAANIFTHIGDGNTFAAMVGKANILTKVGNELTAGLMVGTANIFTHVGDGTSIGLFAGKANIMTKVGDGTTLAAMFGKANIMTHVGDGLTGVLALGEANIVTKVGDDFMGVVAAAKANVVTHVGDATTAAVLAGKGNILTKVGDGTTVGLLLSDIGNVMTHVGDGMTLGFAKGKANIITKVGDGLGVNAGWGNANVFTHVGEGDRYNFAKGEANLITKVGDGQEVSVVHGKANIITHIGDGNDYTGAWGKANVITKVGDGRNVVLAKGEANIVTQVGNGDSFNALWSKGNIVTKVGDGMQVTAAKGKANIVTTVGNGLSVTATYGDANINTKVGDGISVNVAWGKYNVNTKVGDGLNVAVMKGKANVNIHVGDGLGINASYAQNNVAIKIGNGDFYSLAVASSNTKSNKLSSLFDTIKQTVLGVGGSQAINYLVHGDDASSSGTRKGRGAIATPEITKLDGFQMDEIEEVGTDLGDNLVGGVSDVKTPDLDVMQNDLDVDEASDTTQSPNLIVNGDFEQGGHGWGATNGIEASYAAACYGNSDDGHGSRVSELDVAGNTSLYQDLSNLTKGELISLSFDFANRDHEAITNNEGFEVLWNGDVVFSSSDDDASWQHKTLKLTAQAGSNRIEFKGTGLSNGVGYILDNVVAKSEMSMQTNAVSEHAEQNEAAQNAMGDKAQAEADRQRLEQEKEKQLAAVSGSQAQLESTDQEALASNGQVQREAVKGESDAVTEELTAMTQGLDKLDGHKMYRGESGNSWREHFAGGILDDVEAQLDQSKAKTSEYLTKSQQQIAESKDDAKDSVAKSEAGVAKGEQNRAGAEQDITDAKVEADNRKAEALAQQNRAKAAENEARSASDDARSRGKQDKLAAESEASQVQADAEGAKQNEGDRPDREGASGSGLSGKQYQGHAQGDTTSHVDAEGQSRADGRFSEGLTDEEQDALDGATQAVNRLQINAGVRAQNTGTSITSMFTKSTDNGISASVKHGSQDVRRKEIQVSGVNLEGLGEVNAAAKSQLMSVSELLDSAYVKGKVRGESYQNVVDALADYHAVMQDTPDHDAIDKLTNLRKQVEGYVLGHPDSGRLPAMKSLLSQIEVRIDESSALMAASDESMKSPAGFSRLYDQLDNANVKESKHLYVDGNGDFVTKGKENITEAHKLESGDLALDKVKAAVSKEYGQGVADAVFADLKATDLASDGKGIDIAGLNKVHRAIEQQLSPVSATLFVWKPSDHSKLGHAALQIGQGRVQVDAQDAPEFNQKNYVSWWPLDSKSFNPKRIMGVVASPHETLASDVESEENDNFGMHDGDRRLERFIEKLNAVKGVDAKFKDISEAFTMTALMNPEMLESAGIPPHVYEPFVEQWNDTSYDMMDVAKRFAEELQHQAKANSNSALMEKRIGNVVRQFADRALDEIEAFKTQEAEQGRVFRINLEGLDVAAMQAEWNRLSNDPDARYQLVTKNCSTTVAKVLKAGGADKLIGHTWTPNVGIWTPKALFKYGQALQEAQLEIAAKKENRQAVGELEALSGKSKQVETVTIDTEDTDKTKIDSQRNAFERKLRESMPFYSLRSERNMLVQEGEAGFEVRAWPGNGDEAKLIFVEDPDDTDQIKSVERFILANYDSYEQLPDKLFQVNEKVISHHDGRTRILAQKVEGAWQYNLKSELMSVSELLDSAYVKGKVRGESYQNVVDALADYHAAIQDTPDHDAIDILTNLRKQVEGYVLGHPDSGRLPAMKSLLSQIEVRIDESSALMAASDESMKSPGGFSRLYDQLDNANVKESKHLYVDGNGDFVTKGKENITEAHKLESGDLALDKVKAAVSKEYGQGVADAVFADLKATDLASDGKGIDIAGLNKVHRAIEQQLSPVSATLFVWKPSDHSKLGHAALQIGQGRVQVDAQDAPEFNQKNYVSWWPLDSKSFNPKRIMGVVASPHETLASDVESEENDNFGMHDGDRRLERFIEKLNAVKGVDAKFKDISEAFTMTALMNPEMLESAGIPPHVYEPFVEQWNDTSYDMMDVAKRFAEELQYQAKANSNSALMEKRIGNVVRQFADRALDEIEAFKTQEAEQGRVFRINLEGLDVAAMQAEWNRLSNDPDARYQLVTKNCSTTVAKVLKAGGADKLIGHTWTPNVGIWTPKALFKYGQALQEAQLEIAAKKQNRQVATKHDLEQGNDNSVEKTIVSETDTVSEQDPSQKNYQSRDLVLEPIKQPEMIELGMPEADQKVLAKIADRENVIIGVRPVDEKSKSLIDSKMYSSKGLFVKAKSSDWGPMSGFIPVDQSFAKASARRDLEKFNGYAEQSIQSGNAVSADLYLNQRRVDDLVSKYHSLTAPELDAESGMYKTTATNGDQTVSFFLNKVTVDGKELWQVHYMKDGELAPFKVIGDPISKQPMTADYDLLTVMHAYGDLGPKDKVKQPLTWEQWKESVTYEDLTPKYKELYDNEALYNKKDGASLGIVNDRLKELKDVINTGLGRTNGLEMVHHGADDANPYAVMADNFPATFFVPKSFFEEDGLGEGKGSIQTYFNVNEQGAVVIRNPQEFSNFQQVAINASYRGAFNDKWNAGLDKPLFTKDEKRSHAFLDARDELSKKLNGGSNSQLEELGGEKDGKVVHTIDTLQPSEILDQVIRDLNKSSTVMSETNFYDPKKFESDSARVKAEWKQTLTNINNIRNMYFPHDMVRYFEALKSYKVGNCGDRALYAAHLMMDKYNFQGEVELLKLKGSGDHVFVRIGGTSDSAKIIDPWTGQHFAYSQIKTFLYNPKKKKVEVHRSFDELKTLFKDLHQASLSSVTKAQNRNVDSWKRVAVSPQADGGETRFDGQIIIQTENDPVAAKAAARLAGKHPENSVVVQLDADGKYHVVYGEPSQLSGKLRWQVVGHGRDESETNNTRLSGYSADELAVKLAKFNQDFSQAKNITAKPDHISIVGCSLVSDDKQEGFARRFVTAMDEQGIRSDVAARSTEMAVDETGRKYTRDGDDKWAHKLADNKVVLSWSEQGEVLTHNEAIRNGIAEGDIDLARVGQGDSDAPARGAIGDNSDVFSAPEKRKNSVETSSSNSSDRHLSYSGNIQVNVGDGEFTAVNWGTSNVGIKVGTGGFKSLAFGDNNVMVHVGNGDSKHSFDMAGYQALEGAQMFIGNRNVSFNMGRSNDLIVMMDKSIPTPPLVNPFDGASRISGVLQGIARSGEGQDWLAAQEKQWTLSGAKKFVKDMSGLDQSSSVDYTSLVELDSQHERSSRGLKYDAEATLNKQYNKWLSGNSNSDTSKMSRADKFRQANEKLAFNFAVGGQGADIQITTGNWNFMFGDNVQSILDTNLGSLFGLMTQQFSATGQAKTTFTYSPQDLPRQLKNKLLGKLAGVGADTTLGDIFGVDYTAGGHIVSRNGESVDGVAILKEMLEVIGEFSGDQLQAFTDPAKLLDSLKSGIDMGADGIKSFAESHGLKEKAPEEEEDKSSVSVNGSNAGVEQAAGEKVASADSTKQERAFGFNALNLPNLFATIFSQDKQTEMKSLVENLKDNLTADLLNMKEQTFDFLRNSGHLQGDGDINVSLGNYNFNWGGDGKDLGAYLGDNNNFWGGRGDDVYYATGTSNIFTGGEGNDMGVLMGRENMMFGGDGNDTAVVAGRINHVFMGAGNDKSFVFGEGGEINTGTGRDYVVTSGNFNRVDTGEDQDYSVTIGNNNQVELGGGNDFANVFGNYNRVNGSAGNDVIKLMGYHAVLNGGEGDDHLIAAAISKFSQFDGGQGRDMMVLGGYQNTFKGGEDVDSFIVSGNVIDNLVEDIRSEDNIVFNGVDWQNLWFERSGYDLKLSVLREPEAETDQAKFESVGSVTFDDYFNGNRAELVIGMGEKDTAGEREYTALSDNAVDALVQAMSSFAPQAGDNGFIDNLDSKARVAVTTAWSDVTSGKGAIA